MTGKVIYNVFEAVNLAKPVKDWLTYQGEYVTDGNGQVIFVDGLVKYASSDGVDDVLINADCSSLGLGHYVLRGQIKVDAVSVQQMTIGNTTVTANIGVVNDWVNFESTISSQITPNMIAVGYGYPTTRSSAKWKNIKLYATDIGGNSFSDILAYWPLNEQASGDLNGVTATDIINGFNGVHIGGTGGFEAI